MQKAPNAVEAYMAAHSDLDKVYEAELRRFESSDEAKMETFA